MLRQPGPALAIVSTLGLAIAATTTVFAFVDSLLLRPYPFRDPDQLVEIHSERGGQKGKLSMREVLDLRERVPSLQAIAAHTGSEGGYNFSGEGRPEEWKTVLTTGDLFQVLGVPVAIGTTWPQPSDRTRDYAVVLSYGVWKRDFGGRNDVVGRRITLDHAPGYTIYGVTASGFDFPKGIEVYRSLGGFAAYERNGYRNVLAVARMRNGVGAARLAAELKRFSAQLAHDFPETNRGLVFTAESFRDLYSGDVRPYLWLLLGAVVLVLLMASGNVANMLLASATGRNREFAIRSALGASGREIVLQLMVESSALAALASVVGLLLSLWAVRLMRGLIGAELPEWMTIGIDARVLSFAAATGGLAAFISGMAPAIGLAHHSLTGALREGDRSSSASASANRLRDGMVVAQMAMAVVLLTGAGLLIRGFADLQSQRKGFESGGVSTFRVALGWKRYITSKLEANYYERGLRRLEGEFGGGNVAFSSLPPLIQQEPTAFETVQAEGQSDDQWRHNPYVNRMPVSENFFSLLQIPVLAGRSFGQADTDDREPVAVVSQRLAAILWPSQSAIGKRLRYSPSSASRNRSGA